MIEYSKPNNLRKKIFYRQKNSGGFLYDQSNLRRERHGKTKQMIDAANAAVATAKGHLIFITDTKRGMYDLARDIRFIDVTDFDVAGEAALCGFIKGVIAGQSRQRVRIYRRRDAHCRQTRK